MTKTRLFAAEGMGKVGVAADIGCMFIFGSQDGGNHSAISDGFANLQTRIRVHAQNHSENGALDHGGTQMATAYHHAIRFPPSFRCKGTHSQHTFQTAFL